MTTSVPVRTPSREVTEELAAQLVDAGGYTHPLFHPDEPADRPLPGQAVLLLMGGMVEQSGALDHAVALLEIRRARFTSMVRPGQQLQVELASAAPEPVKPGLALQEVTWTAYTDDQEVVATVDVVMLVKAPSKVPGEEGEE